VLVIGAGGHAKEILQILTLRDELAHLFFFDEVDPSREAFFGRFPILHRMEDALAVLAEDPRFALGIGGTEARGRLAGRFEAAGGRLTGVVSPESRAGAWNCRIDPGADIMSGVFVSNDVRIAKGVLLNAGCQIHHDAEIGRYSEISPGALVLGGARIGEFVAVGGGAILLPGVTLGDRATVGAGAVVLENVPAGESVAGIPAQPIRKAKAGP